MAKDHMLKRGTGRQTEHFSRKDDPIGIVRIFSSLSSGSLCLCRYGMSTYQVLRTFCAKQILQRRLFFGTQESRYLVFPLENRGPRKLLRACTRRRHSLVLILVCSFSWLPLASRIRTESATEDGLLRTGRYAHARRCCALPTLGDARERPVQRHRAYFVHVSYSVLRAHRRKGPVRYEVRRTTHFVHSYVPVCAPCSPSCIPPYCHPHPSYPRQLVRHMKTWAPASLLPACPARLLGV